MKILILGGTGAMGTPLTQILANRGHEVFVTSRREHKTAVQQIQYRKGDAQDLDFLRKLLQEGFDAVVDFMSYGTETFRSRYQLLLEHTKHYLFLSSARVYANQENSSITEQSPRLLEVVQDDTYKQTDEYALAKAREETLLQNAPTKNWTIIRPYITYNNERLQLGTLEKERWLQRALRGKAIVFSKDVAARYTTLTYGNDVALRIANLIGKKAAMGQVFQIATNQCVRWEDILTLYLRVLEEKAGVRPRVYMLESADFIARACRSQYAIQYDRLFNRRFDSQKVQEVVDVLSFYTDVEEGLRACLERFLEGPRTFRPISWRIEGAFDRLTGDRTRLREIDGWKNKAKYFLCRYIGVI